MRTFQFTIQLRGIDDLTDGVADAVCGACSDATLILKRGDVFLTFSREAESFGEAIATAMRDIRRLGFDPRVVQI